MLTNGSNMAELTLHDLVSNRTLAPGMAALLAAAAEERRSLLMVAIPRMAGKSTLMEAVLEERATGVPVYLLGTRHGDSLGIPSTSKDIGYLTMSEIARHPVTDSYLWGDHVQQIFEAARLAGHAIATSLHADGVESAFEVIAETGVTDEQASLIDLVVYIRSIGEWRNPERRVVECLYEVDGVEARQPSTRLIHRWHEISDTFEEISEPVLVPTEAYKRQLERFNNVM